MQDDAAIAHLRRRRSTYFFGDPGPLLPAGMSARWRLTRGEPHGWHANMVGFVDGPPAQLGALLDLAVDWFTHHGVDTWVDVDEFGALWRYQHLIADRGFRLVDDWDAMICRRVFQDGGNDQIALHSVHTR